MYVARKWERDLVFVCVFVWVCDTHMHIAWWLIAPSGVGSNTGPGDTRRSSGGSADSAAACAGRWLRAVR